MKTLVSMLGLLAVFTVCAVSAPVDLSAPATTIGASDSKGYLRIWREIGEIDYGEGMKLPVRIEFSSARQSSSPLLGKGWWCPMLESSAYLIRESMLKATLMCGKTMYLRRDNKNSNTFHTLDKEWKAVQEGNSITISREDGWKIVYDGGKVQSLTTDKGRTLLWKYDEGQAVEVYEPGGINNPFQVKSVIGSLKGQVDINGEAHELVFDRRPRVQPMGNKNIVGGFDLALFGWQWPDGTEESYEFAVTEKNLDPNLKVTGKEEKDPVTYVWDAESGHIVSDGEWTYKIGKNRASIRIT